MSKDFLAIAQANSKLCASIAGTTTSFVTKEQCINAGADASKLTGYPAGGFPVDDDVVSGRKNRLSIRGGYSTTKYYMFGYPPEPTGSGDRFLSFFGGSEAIFEWNDASSLRVNNPNSLGSTLMDRKSGDTVWIRWFDNYNWHLSNQFILVNGNQTFQL